MPEKKEDRRIRRTKALLRAALAELMGEKNFNEITVKDITERADINRGTFYLHYKDTYDLRERIEDEFIVEFEDMLEAYELSNNSIPAHAVIERLYEYISENRAIFKVLFFNTASSDFIEKVMSAMWSKSHDIQGTLYKNLSKTQGEYVCSFLIYGIVGVVKNWFHDDNAISKELFTDIVNRMISAIMSEVSS